jgi:hypothetical protein
VPFQHRELLAEYEVLKKEVLTLADKPIERPEPQVPVGSGSCTSRVPHLRVFTAFGLSGVSYFQ